MLRTMTLALTFSFAVAQAALAEDLPEIAITLKDHKFTPSEVHVSTGKPVVLVITNQDAEADEFEMHLPALEKVVPPGGTVKVRLRPLGPGSFPFMGEFHAETAKGVIISQ
jgi:uncharacterized cupredoxin-like copper-binding protein